VPIPPASKLVAECVQATRFGQNQGMTIEIRGMPWPIRLFLVYAFLILAGIGLSLRFVVDQAIAAPVSPVGIVVMVLLAYTIFTTTLVLQRKIAARSLALGLATLTVPPIPWAIVVGPWPVAVFFLALAILLIRGLRSPTATAWLAEE
jgi:predicted lysophospholipase L1 biosynthesis ABC-type transport system permease subunit